MGKIIKIFFVLLFFIFVAGAGLAYYFLFEKTPPEINIISLPSSMGQEGVIEIQATDDRSGLRELSVQIIQDAVKKEYKDEFKRIDFLRGSGVKDFQKTIKIKPKEAGFRDGAAQIKITARDSSLLDAFKGNKKIMEKVVVIDTAPPRIYIKSGTQYLASGGAGLVSYTINEKVSKAGVWLDDLYFPSHNINGNYVSLIAVPYNKKKINLIQIKAVDPAGNSTVRGLTFHLKYKSPKLDDIKISDSFLQRKMPEFRGLFPDFTGSNEELFIKINTQLRSENNNKIRSVSKSITPEILWTGRFVSLPRGAFRAGFPDKRHYFYKGKEVSQSHHMGVDLASVRNAPVPAANSGIVAFADFLGIYGNTVIIDHGMGLFSLYGHLSRILVQKGDKVGKGTIIAFTGNTGLAGGDHLHYASLINGIFVNPVEWWDEKWINDHIIINMR